MFLGVPWARKCCNTAIRVDHKAKNETQLSYNTYSGFFRFMLTLVLLKFNLITLKI